MRDRTQHLRVLVLRGKTRVINGFRSPLPLLFATICISLAPGNPALAAGQLQGRVVERRTGRPVAGAEVSILGHPGERRTDADGRFTWQPSPPPPFEVLVILPGGRYAKPVLVETLADGPVDISVEYLVNES